MSMYEGTPVTPTPEPPQKWTAAKFWVALVTALLVTASQIFTTGTVARVIAIILTFLGSITVYVWGNKPIDPNND